MEEQVVEALNTLTQEAREIYLPQWVPEVYEVPSSMDFLRNYVSKNLPLVIRGATNNWPAVQKWDSKYFKSTYGDKRVTVAVTPNGYADGIARYKGREFFVMPEEQTMTFGEFLDNLDSYSRSINYIQTQNNNLIGDFPEFLDDIDTSVLSFAQEAFGKQPDATNFWMGDERAITSMHKDPYENIYCVISGYKDFVLIPPTEVHSVPRKRYQSAVFKTNGDGEMLIEALFGDDKKPLMIEWVCIDPLEPDLEEYPSFVDAKKYVVRLNAGDILYLPSLWYHHVRQSHKNISVNYWYDMDYDSRYCYYKMIENLCGYGG